MVLWVLHGSKDKGGECRGGTFRNLTAGPSFSGSSSPLSNVCRALLRKGVEMAHQNDEMHTVIQKTVNQGAK